MTREKIRSYQELVAWRKAMALVTEIYQITKQFPQEELFGLTSQMRRAAVSIPSNIAEGHDRASSGEFRQFLGHARGSVAELETQILLSLNLSYLSETETARLLESVKEIGKLLNGLMAAMKNRNREAAMRGRK